MHPRGLAAALAARLPEPLAPLARLAWNAWWSWQPEGAALFQSIDPDLWAHSGRDPLAMLRATHELPRLALDGSFVARVKTLENKLDAYLERPVASAADATTTSPIAIVAAEYAAHPCLPLAAGGLGILAGDLLKEASDLALPVVGVGLLYRRGDVRQRLDTSGAQHEHRTTVRAESLPVEIERDQHGDPLLVTAPIGRREIWARVLRADIGRVPLYLLDTDLPHNPPVERWVGADLYTSDAELRLYQYALLGIGGARALAALGIVPSIVHLVEAHGAMMPLAEMVDLVSAGASAHDAIEALRRRTVLTARAAHADERAQFPSARASEVLAPIARGLGVRAEVLVDLGRKPTRAPKEPFGLSELASRVSRAAFGTSEVSANRARATWSALNPGRSAAEAPIAHAAAGVHLPTWVAPPMRALFAHYLGEGWEARAAEPTTWAKIDAIPDEVILSVRAELRARLVTFVRARSVAERLARGEPLSYVEAAARTFDRNTLTLGFGRRLSSSTRLSVLLADAARALTLLRGARPIQVVIAGKAHPRDEASKLLIKSVFALKNARDASTHVVFLEDYDTAMAAELVAGCDVWLSLPRRGRSAGGMSSLKAAMNGALALGVLDAEAEPALVPGSSFTLGEHAGGDDASEDTADAAELFRLLEREVAPCFYERDASGVARRWAGRIKASLREVGGRATTLRSWATYLRAYEAKPR